MIKKRFRVVNHDEYDYELDYITDNYKRMHIEDVCNMLNTLYEENQHLQKMNELLIAEIRWNKEQKLQSKDKTPRITPKEFRERIKND